MLFLVFEIMSKKNCAPFFAHRFFKFEKAYEQKNCILTNLKIPDDILRRFASMFFLIFEKVMIKKNCESGIFKY